MKIGYDSKAYSRHVNMNPKTQPGSEKHVERTCLDIFGHSTHLDKGACVWVVQSFRPRNEKQCLVPHSVKMFSFHVPILQLFRSRNKFKVLCLGVDSFNYHTSKRPYPIHLLVTPSAFPRPTPPHSPDIAHWYPGRRQDLACSKEQRRGQLWSLGPREIPS